MTHKERNKFRDMLIERKGILDFEDDNPFVAIYFDDLVYLVEQFTEERNKQ